MMLGDKVFQFTSCCHYAVLNSTSNMGNEKKLKKEGQKGIWKKGRRWRYKRDTGKEENCKG